MIQRFPTAHIEVSDQSFSLLVYSLCLLFVSSSLWELSYKKQHWKEQDVTKELAWKAILLKVF